MCDFFVSEVENHRTFFRNSFLADRVRVVLPRGESKRIEVGKCVHLDSLRTFEVNRSEVGDPRK
jgi:hypothetical protein